MRTSRLALLAALVAACGNPGFDRRGPSGRRVGERCNSASDCQQGLYCVEQTCAATLPVGACTTTAQIVLAEPVVPASRPDPIPDPPCALPVRSIAPSFPAAQVQDKGAHPVGSVIQFEVPEKTTSFSIVSQEVDGSAVNDVTLKQGGQDVSFPNTVQPTNLLAPGSVQYYDDLAAIPADPSTLFAQYVGFQPSTGVMTLPNTSRALDIVRSTGGLPAGTWQFTLTDTAAECKVLGCTADHANGIYDVKILTRPGTLDGTGTLDADVYFVSQDPDHPTLTAADATADPATNDTARHFQRFVSTLSQLFSRVGVCLGTVRVHAMPDWARSDFHDLDIDKSDPCSPMPRLFTLAAPESGVHLFFVDTIVTATAPGGGAVIVGIDGSIPGPSAVPGTLNSGAAVVLANFGLERTAGACSGPADVARCGTDQVAYIAAHEAGHWLGLYHTTESSGTFFDPLTDTASCACDTCAPAAQRAQCPNGNVKLFSSSCSGKVAGCGGADNLMFWLVDPDFSTGALSPQQGEVMRSNPAVH
ncbi:zinc metalloprotease [Anaeromyxobacter oryzae]|uniref:hypothetical protein n=1 Tax=Anaeromyxobacter oryzae TaxID=2918170 RepID=UPI0020BEE48C|nr:hypothetical protein [Anaeromyxobacter oryzae]